MTAGQKWMKMGREQARAEARAEAQREDLRIAEMLMKGAKPDVVADQLHVSLERVVYWAGVLPIRPSTAAQ